MRELTSLKDRVQAGRLAAYLAVQGIHATADEDDGEWIIWVHNDDDREQAGDILAQFQQDPNDPKFENAERKVRHVLIEADRLQRQMHQQGARLKKRWSGSWWHCFPATYIMIGLCVAVAVLCTEWFPPKVGALGPLLCNNRRSELLNSLGVVTPVKIENENGVPVQYFLRTPEFPKQGLTAEIILAVLKSKTLVTVEALKVTILSGQLWRPVTPIFIHLSILHILFNMMWLRAMGSAIEFVRGTWRFVILCLILAVISNIGQLFWSGPMFGGMSGVVFGLVGYVWMKGKTQPHLGIGLMQQTLVFVVLWLVLCMAGVFGPIANAAHLFGFLAGILIGARQAIWKKIPFTK